MKQNTDYMTQTTCDDYYIGLQEQNTGTYTVNNLYVSELMHQISRR